MNELLKLLADNPAVRSLIRGESSLGNLSASEEALLLAAAFGQFRHHFDLGRFLFRRRRDRFHAQ